MRFSVLLYGLLWALRFAAWRSASMRAHLRAHDFTAQMRTKDGSRGRWYAIKDGRISSGAGLHNAPDMTLSFETAELAARLMMPPIDWLAQVSAQKNFELVATGPDELIYHWAQAVMMTRRLGWRFGRDMGNGVTRYATNTNGGPCFIDVKDGRILRLSPIEFDDKDAKPWTIEARGQALTPPRKTSLSPHGLNFKSMVYSPDRLLTPMKRVDFDPDGARNPQNRGVSGYEPISWDQALDIVAGEIKRAKRVHGPGAIAFNHGAHHTKGNIGYYMSALFRFANAIGHTKIVHNPDSWEGWYWGAIHHWGYSMRLGLPEGYGTVEDCLKESDMAVFWSCDPEATSGIYAGHEGTIRRQWMRDLGIEVVHIDPYRNSTASFMGGKWIAPRPGTDAALALAIAHVWIAEGLYDKSFVENRTAGFDAWKAYVMGDEDGTPKTPEWQEAETGVPARTVRALARRWGTRRTYLGAGGWGNGLGGACRGPTGHQWARAMACLIAMQGIGRPGVNMGNLQWGTPVDNHFWFPGYGDGGISGDLENTSTAIQLYQRMPHLVSMNTVGQKVPRLMLPDAIINDAMDGGYPRDGRSAQGQFAASRYPAPGHSPIRMLYKYGGTSFSTMPDSERHIRMYRSPHLECVINQSVWFEGETAYADIILPACTSMERWDISEWSGLSGYTHNGTQQNNHRVIVLQHKCIEPLGESKSDYEIFRLICSRLGLGPYYSEGMSDLDWVKRMFDASDLPRVVSWKEFARKGYYVVPAPEPARRSPVGLRWFYEGRKKDTPEPHPLPSEYGGDYLDGLQTASGRFEFECGTLARFDADDAERPPVLHYVPSHEGTHADHFARYPLQLITPHPRYSFHTQGDGKDSFLNDIDDHRILVGGYYYWPLRINPDDAALRGIDDGDLVRVHNDRGSVICAARLTGRMRPGVVHGYESSARIDLIETPDGIMDRGGCLNRLATKRMQFRQSQSMGSSNCLVEVERFTGALPAA